MPAISTNANESNQSLLLDSEIVGSNPVLALPEGNVTGACYACVKFCLRVDNENVQSRAVQALCSIFVGNASIMLHAEKMGLISWILRDRMAGGRGDSVHPAFCDLPVSPYVLAKMLVSLRQVLLLEEVLIFYFLSIKILI